MSRNPRYQKMLNSRRWMEVKRIVWQRANGLCERCREEGFIRAGVDCHHIRPVEGAKTLEGPDGMIARCYDPNNIRLLCVACHIKTHQEMRSHKADKVAENKRRGADRRASWLDPNYEANKVDEPNST